MQVQILQNYETLKDDTLSESQDKEKKSIFRSNPTFTFEKQICSIWLRQNICVKIDMELLEEILLGYKINEKNRNVRD